jgi:hypothetical protein
MPDTRNVATQKRMKARPSKANSLEYRLFITPHRDDHERYATSIRLETSKLFASFPYELSVEESLDERSLKLRVTGLKAPHLTIPSPGHAHWSKTIEGLEGIFDVSVEGLDGKINSFRVKIQPTKVELLEVPAQRFVEAIVGSTSPSSHK